MSSDYSQDKCIHELFETQVARRPDAVAVQFEDRVPAKQVVLTYRELNRRANQLARYLQALGVGPEVRVGLCIERSPEIVVALLAILKAGGAYVPMDPSHPRGRLAAILSEAEASVLLTNSGVQAFRRSGVQERCASSRSRSRSKRTVPTPTPTRPLSDRTRTPERPTVVCLDTEWKEIERQPEDAPYCGATLDNLAYVIFTSGSTGAPKGIQIPHGALANLLHALAQKPGLSEHDILIAVTTVAFDMAVFELLLPLALGARIVLLNDSEARDGDRLRDRLDRSGATVVQATPATWQLLLQAGWRGRGSLKLLCGGETLSEGLARKLQARSGSLWNMYGPTETTVWSTAYEIKAEDGPVPIGRPIANTQCHVLDSHLQPVPVGAVGELYIGGAGVARGYLARPDLTAERFVPDPFGGPGAPGRQGGRLYRTGDRARFRPDGNLEFLGRTDHQVKLRGFRIELGEIEAVLEQHSSVRAGVVLLREDRPGDPRLVAYVVPSVESSEFSRPVLQGGESSGGACPNSQLSTLNSQLPTGLRLFLQQKLPEYMVPSAFVLLEALPLTPNGKVERSALPPPDTGRPEAEERVLAPRTPLEVQLAAICSDVLGLDRVGLRDHFFEMGGHSLLATQVIARVRDTFQVEVPLQAFFAAPTVEGLAGTLQRRSPSERRPRMPPILPTPRDADLPLSFSQERVWFIQQLDPDNRAYQFQAMLRFEGQLDLSALRRSLHELVRRHEILRTTFPERNGRAIQVIHAAGFVEMPVVDLRSVADGEREAVLERLISEEFQKPFDLTQLPLIRWTLFQLGPREHVLLHVEHHLVHDGWSFRVILRELLQLYRSFSAGEPSPLPEPAVQFADFAVWQRRCIQGELADSQLAYWRQKLAGSPPLLALPSDHPRPPVQSSRGATRRVELPRDLCRSLQTLCRREGVTLFTLLQAAFQVLLHRCTGQDDLCVGTGVANRRWREIEPMLGMVVNNVVLRTDLSGDPPFRELLQRVRAVTLEAFAHQDLPFERVVEALQPERDLSRNPLFQVMFNFHDAPCPDLRLPDLEVELVEVLSNRTAKFDLNVIVIPRGEHPMGQKPAAGSDEITMIWEYSTDLFEDDTITRMTRYFETLLDGIVADADQRLSELPLLPVAERRQLLQWGAPGIAPRPVPDCIHSLFEAQAAQSPESVAVVCGEQLLTYQELNHRANQVAHVLQSLGIGPEMRVGLCLERSLELVVALLGILKAGGAYVPLDPAYPPERLAFMLADAQISVLLTNSGVQAFRGSGVQERCASSRSRSRSRSRNRSLTPTRPLSDRTRMPQPLTVVCLDTEAERFYQASEQNPRSGAIPESLAYVCYTSGSTGRPKGVCIPHRGVARLVRGADYARFDAGEVFLQFAPLAFDASTFEIWGALLNGARLVLFPSDTPSLAELGDVVQRHQVTTLWLTAGLFHQMLEHELASLRGLRQLLAGGDVLSVPHVQRAARELPDCQVINGYGPTENTTFTCCYSVPPGWSGAGSVPIGRPIAGTQVYVLDAQMQPVPIGVVGELYTGGDGLARSYLNDPALTAERFLPHPHSEQPGARLYRTGDLCRLRPDGNLEFLGRRDQQVKLRGFRIELGEIEAVLGQHPGVRECLVLAREDVPGEKRLVAYVVRDEGEGMKDEGTTDPSSSGPYPRSPRTLMSELRAYLQEKLPEFMVPAAFVELSALPLTPHGKVDRRALPEPGPARPELGEAFVAPRTPVEKVLAGIWTEVLGLERVGVHDDFFELGGHSLLATQVISRAQRDFQVEFPLRRLFEAPTVARMAEAITAWLANGVQRDEIAHLVAELEDLTEEDVQSRLAAEGQ